MPASDVLNPNNWGKLQGGELTIDSLTLNFSPNLDLWSERVV